MNIRALIAPWIAVLSLASNVSAQDAAAKGLEIAKEAKRRDTGYGDFTVAAKMTLENRQGQKNSDRKGNPFTGVGR